MAPHVILQPKPMKFELCEQNVILATPRFFNKAYRQMYRQSCETALCGNGLTFCVNFLSVDEERLWYCLYSGSKAFNHFAQNYFAF
jgi:hypothetical protein